MPIVDRDGSMPESRLISVVMGGGGEIGDVVGDDEGRLTLSCSSELAVDGGCDKLTKPRGGGGTVSS